MEPSLVLLLALTLGPIQPSSGQPLHVDPPEPVVAVALGTSCQLTCSLSCGEGVAQVQWRGLDTTLGSVQSIAGNSILTVHSAKLSDTGTHLCVGSCRGQNYQHSVKILVYAFQDELEVSPVFLVPGQDQEVSCTAHNVWPVGPDTLSFALLLGDQNLEGVQVLELEQEEETEDTEDPLFRVTQRWLVPAMVTPMPPALLCQATMQLPGLKLTNQRVLPVLQIQTSVEPLDTTSAKSHILTSSEPTEAISMGPPDTTTLPSTPQQGLTFNPRTLGSAGTCHPEIRQEQEAGWQLLCEAFCGPGMAVRWTLAPGGLAAYHKTEAGAQAWLSVPPPGPIPEGWFQCRLDPGGQVTSLYVPGQLFSKSGSATSLWTGSLALGLLLLAFLAYRLWKYCRPAAGHPGHPLSSSGSRL
ncbi:mucosal addressin cell adhesion molecule 1 [Nannospalax galili]|uniref:Mucosal addressin cell adhesion molecule 1 n=1 Tax=Nannospalax galili TaxID=1026970 RepID=A0A8C6RTL2_NANGA|nr:mucosal addressin cell adhesion molecule 1 [Nannospalax galili]